MRPPCDRRPHKNYMPHSDWYAWQPYAQSWPAPSTWWQQQQQPQYWDTRHWWPSQRQSWGSGYGPQYARSNPQPRRHVQDRRRRHAPTRHKPPDATEASAPATAQAPPVPAQAPPATSQAPPATAQAPPATAHAPPATAQAPPATAQAPAPAASQHPIITPPGPPTPRRAIIEAHLPAEIKAEDTIVGPSSKHHRRSTTPKKTWQKRYKVVNVLTKAPKEVAQDLGGEASPVVPSQARCIPQPPWLTALLVVKVYPQPLLVVRWGCTALDISRHASARYNPHPHRTRVDSFAFQDQHHITKSTEMVVAPNSTACSTDSKQLKRVVFYSCGRTSPPDLHGILLGSPTPRCEG